MWIFRAKDPYVQPRAAAKDPHRKVVYWHARPQQELGIGPVGVAKQVSEEILLRHQRRRRLSLVLSPASRDTSRHRRPRLRGRVFRQESVPVVIGQTYSQGVVCTTPRGLRLCERSQLQPEGSPAHGSRGQGRALNPPKADAQASDLLGPSAEGLAVLTMAHIMLCPEAHHT